MSMANSNVQWQQATATGNSDGQRRGATAMGNGDGQRVQKSSDNFFFRKKSAGLESCKKIMTKENQEIIASLSHIDQKII
jgi:hypothetical protein